MIGDFNAVLYSGDRIGGDAVMQNEVVDFANCLEVCELKKLQSMGPILLGIIKQYGLELIEPFSIAYGIMRWGTLMSLIFQKAYQIIHQSRFHQSLLPQSRLLSSFVICGPLTLNSTLFFNINCPRSIQALNYSNIVLC